MKPLVERLEKNYKDKVEFRKLNVESDQAAIALANKMGVQYVPTFVFVNSNGVVSKNVVGAMTEQNMSAAVQALQ
jgi:thiol-disulfide isomerase/thioredoxin